MNTASFIGLIILVIICYILLFMGNDSWAAPPVAHDDVLFTEEVRVEIWNKSKNIKKSYTAIVEHEIHVNLIPETIYEITIYREGLNPKIININTGAVRSMRIEIDKETVLVFNSDLKPSLTKLPDGTPKTNVEEGNFYTIQLGKFKTPISDNTYDDLAGVRITRSGGFTYYRIGIYTNHK